MELCWFIPRHSLGGGGGDLMSIYDLHLYTGPRQSQGVKVPEGGHCQSVLRPQMFF